CPAKRGRAFYFAIQILTFCEIINIIMLYKRSDRVGDLIRQVVSEMLLRELNDPRLESVTITEVEVTDDLKLATVFFSAMGSKPLEEEALQGLQSAGGYIKKKLGKELRLRYVPDLLFKLDRSFEYGRKIDRLIQTIQEEKDRNLKEDR
ncbi:MAG: 30S ribosome-binding factor RbfA, partial [Thermodesulfobacteriota bacterium]|nr:30S ribosome-binding factor RbfA [Thermodesulfobacteriota bacterium]